MEIKNRLPDVYNLMAETCQDYLRLIVKDGWQQQFYSKVEEGKEGVHKNKYIEAYNDIRDKGVDYYSVDDMDITVIFIFVCYCGIIFSSKKTRDALEKVKNDKNSLQSHIKLNEPSEELYLRAILALYNLRDFVRTVDNEERQIKDSLRAIYRKTHIDRIKNLVAVLDDERIDIVQKKKEHEKNIQIVLNSKNPSLEWEKVVNMYFSRCAVNKTQEEFLRFAVAASDAGISYAHIYAANYYYFIRDYSEFERRLLLDLARDNNIPRKKAQDILTRINLLLKRGKILPNSEETEQLIDRIISEGFVISKDDEGMYLINS